MKWILVLISMNLYADGSADHFVFTNTMYHSVEECQAVAQINMKNIEDIAIREFNGPAKVYCFREDNFIKYMNQKPPEKNPKVQL